MIILPAIDIKDGACVRLQKGSFDTVEKVAEDALLTAQCFRAAGARWMHMVDLDGARTGARTNRTLIQAVIQSSGLKVELGGGIRDMQGIEDALAMGAQRVILGSAALKNPTLVTEAVRAYGARIAVGIDARGGLVAAQGWVEDSAVSYLTLGRRMADAGVKTLIFTDIDCDGMLTGPNFDQLSALQSAVSCRLIASGGIRDIRHIRRLRAMGFYGAICGKSIYSGTLDLGEAIREGGDQDAE